MSSAPKELRNREEDTATFREFREYTRGTLDVDHQDVYPIAGLIQDEEVAEALMFMAESYSPSAAEIEAGMPRSFWDTSLAQKAIRKYGTKRATRAVEEGNQTLTAFLTGLPSYNADISGLHTINRLSDWLIHSEQTKLIYLAALMGRGKTDLALTLLQMVWYHYHRLQQAEQAKDVPEPKFAANFYADAGQDTTIQEIHSFDDLQEWADGHSSEDELWFIFDEASTELTAQSGSNAQDVAETMAPFVKKMRKSGVNMLVIGHDKQDVHPAIRSLADFIDKTGLKTASFYAGIQNRQPHGHLFDVEGIPQTAWTFDTDDVAEWSWGDLAGGADGFTPDELEDEVAWRAAILYQSEHTDISQRKLADAVSNEDLEITRNQIVNRLKKMEDGEAPPSRRAPA